MKSHAVKPAAIAALITSTLIAACGGGAEEGNDKKVLADSTASIRVITSVVQPRVFEDWGVYSAELRGVEDAQLTAPTPGGGRVSKVSETGASVAKGAPLCDIDSELYGALLKQAESAVALATGELARAKENVKEGFVGEASLDKAELDNQNARAALFQAKRAYADSRCEAPFAGVLVSRTIERHQTVAPGAPTVRVANLSRLEALVSIPEAEAPDYREGQRAEFTVVSEGDDASPMPGVISSLDRSVESRNRVVNARVRIENTGKDLRPGMIGRVGVLRRRYEKALVVASTSVLRLQEGTAVMRVENGISRQIPVTLGPTRGDSVVVLSGLNAGDRVITTGAFQVSEGTKVEF